MRAWRESCAWSEGPSTFGSGGVGDHSEEIQERLAFRAGVVGGDETLSNHFRAERGDAVSIFLTRITVRHGAPLARDARSRSRLLRRQSGLDGVSPHRDAKDAVERIFVPFLALRLRAANDPGYSNKIDF